MGTRGEAARKRRFKADVYAAVASVPGALANRHRLEMLDLIAQRPRTVQDLAAEANLTVANASQHLRVLAEAGLACVERRGTYKFYRAADRSVYRLLVALRAVAETVDAGVAAAEQAYFGRRDPAIATFAEALDVLADPRTALLDARPPEEFAVAHLPGARNAPVEALQAGAVALQAGERFVVYCRGPFCVFADEAVALLRDNGFEATRLALGPAEWLAAGGEVERAG